MSLRVIRAIRVTRAITVTRVTIRVIRAIRVTRVTIRIIRAIRLARVTRRIIGEMNWAVGAARSHQLLTLNSQRYSYLCLCSFNSIFMK